MALVMSVMRKRLTLVIQATQLVKKVKLKMTRELKNLAQTTTKVKLVMGSLVTRMILKKSKMTPNRK